MTALQTTRDGVAYPTTVKKTGWIVAFTVGPLGASRPTAPTERNDIHTLDQTYGGTPSSALTVLRPGPKKTRKYTVAAQSPIFHVIPYLGQVRPVAPLHEHRCPSRQGDVVGLTSPTWAPVLSYNLTASKFAYRQSRSGATARTRRPTRPAQLAVGRSTRSYLCNYTGPRVRVQRDRGHVGRRGRRTRSTGRRAERRSAQRRAVPEPQRR